MTIDPTNIEQMLDTGAAIAAEAERVAAEALANMEVASESAEDLIRVLAQKHAFMVTVGGQGGPDWTYRSVEALVLAEGQTFGADAGQVRYMEGVDGTPKNCFEDALLLALEHASEGWSYAEGYATGSIGIDVHHAWCVDDEGRVVDPTWQAVAAAHGESFPYEHSAYIGIVFNPDAAVAAVKVDGAYGILFSSLTGGLLERGLDSLPLPEWMSQGCDVMEAQADREGA